MEGGGSMNRARSPLTWVVVGCRPEFLLPEGPSRTLTAQLEGDIELSECAVRVGAERHQTPWPRQSESRGKGVEGICESGGDLLRTLARLVSQNGAPRLGWADDRHLTGGFMCSTMGGEQDMNDSGSRVIRTPRLNDCIVVAQGEIE